MLRAEGTRKQYVWACGHVYWEKWGEASVWPMRLGGTWTWVGEPSGDVQEAVSENQVGNNNLDEPRKRKKAFRTTL